MLARTNICSITILVSLLGACAEVPTRPSSAPQPVDTFADFVVKLDRLDAVAMGSAVAAAALCKTNVQATYGFELHDKSQYARLFKGKYLEPAVQHYGLRDGVWVRYSHPTLPAGLAGLRARARIISLDGEPLDNKTADDANEILWRFERRREGPLHVVFADAEARVRELDLYSVPACKYPVVLVPSNVVYAYTDGTKIVITTGMLDFTASDAELALVIGHEIAHNALGYVDDMLLRNILNSIFTAHAGQQPAVATTSAEASFSKEAESQADYVGLYIAARAGYDISGIGQLWGRFARYQTPVNAPAFAVTHPHPSNPERLEAFRSTLREIRKKQERDEPLLPEALPIRPIAQP
ncbi:MAG TPA: M48 family metalloprotease [Nitrospirales bacterium]